MPAHRSLRAIPNDKVASSVSPPWQILATSVSIVVYIVLFYWIDPRRQLILGQLLVPDDLISSWVDFDWSRFGLLDHLPVLAGATLICVVAGLTGWLVLHLLRATKALDVWEETVLAVAVGFNVWSLLTLALGLAGLLKARWLFAILALLFTVLAVLQLWTTRRTRLHGNQQGTDAESPALEFDSKRTFTGFGRIALVLCLPLVAVMLLGGTLPATHFDVREYHLQVPKEWFQQGQVTFLPHNVYGNMPLGAEMHTVLGMLLASGKDDWWWGALIGKTVIAFYAPLAAAGVFLIGRRFISGDAGAWGAFAYLATPWVAHVSMTGLIDGAVGAYVITATLAALIATHNSKGHSTDSSRGRNPLVMIAGFLAGGAVSCKYPSLLFLVLPLGILVTIVPRWRIDWKSATLFIIAVFVGCGLWFAKNWAMSGNPTYPLMYSVFDGKSWNPEKNARWTKAHGPPHDANGNQFTPSQIWDSVTLLAIRSDHHGAWILPLAVSAFWAWRRPQSRWLIAILYGIVAFAILSWWILTHRVDRFLVPMLPLVAVGAGIGATWTDDAAWRRIVTLLGMGCAVLSFVQIASPYAADNRFLISLADLRTDRPRFQHQSTRMNDGHRWLNEHVQPGNRVLLVGEAQVFDLEMPILYNTCFDDCVLEVLLRDRSLEERRQIFKEQRISHIFVSWYELNRYRMPGNYGYSDYPTRELFHNELVKQQRLLRPLPVGASSEVFEVFEVLDVTESSRSNRSEAPAQ